MVEIYFKCDIIVVITSMVELTMASYNVRGLVNVKKSREIFYYLRKKPYDVISMQETHSSPSQLKRWRTEWGGRLYCSHGSNNARGVTISVKKRKKLSVKGEKKDPKGRFLILNCLINGDNYLLVNVYGPNHDSQEFFTELTESIDELNVDQKIISGDFNFVLNTDIDKQGGLPSTNNNSRDFIASYVLNNNGLCDIWREMHLDEFKFTWKRLPPNPILVRLDFSFSDIVAQMVSLTDITPSFSSDHSIPFIHIKFQENSQGPGLWKLNISLLLQRGLY